MAGDVAPAEVPLPGSIISVILSLTTFGVLCMCLVRRIQPIKRWNRLPLATWLILIIYIDSALFVFVTDIIARGFGINSSIQICEGAILLCLVCYMSTKVLIYFFLVERAYIIRGSRLPRRRTKLWLFNFFGMIIPYVVVIIMNFIWRIAYINDQGVCIIGMKKESMLPLISLDVVINIYMTLLFLIPLRRLYSYQHNTNTSLHKMAFRTFIGSCATLTSSVVNLTVLMILKGEPGWICLMCCNADILFSVLVLHWVTAIDSTRSASQNSHGGTNNGNNANLNVVDEARSRRESLNMWAGKRISEPKKAMMAGTITTECMGGKNTVGRESQDEIVELHKITVRTEQTQEIEIDGRSDNTERDVEFHGSFGERSVSAEKMV